jgi:hypothetical protein
VTRREVEQVTSLQTAGLDSADGIARLGSTLLGVTARWHRAEGKDHGRGQAGEPEAQDQQNKTENAEHGSWAHGMDLVWVVRVTCLLRRFQAV